MKCPKCTNDMETVKYGSGDRQVQRCTHCSGIWFKPSDVTRLKHTFKAEVIDAGDPKIGQEFNKIENINCPVCEAKMDLKSDNKQTHIWYESCPEGHGMFFDAGEFTDLAQETFSDYIKSWVTGERP